MNLKERPVDAETFDDLLTCHQVQELFDRGELTIANWRKKYGMPHVVIRSKARTYIRFRLERVTKWAAEVDAKMCPTVLAALRRDDASAKPNPRRRTVAAATSPSPRRRLASTVG